MKLTIRQAGALLAVSLTCGAISLVRAQEPANSRIPEAQKESDWVDARWNRTDLGRFHASILPLPNGRISKGLSIRLGENAAVVYDTETATLRGGWVGGFLKFNAARYGLIEAPQPAGTVQFLSPPDPAWLGLPVRWRGLHINGSRVVLDYEVDGKAISESPSFENFAGLNIFSRTLDLSPHRSVLTLGFLSATGRTFSFEQRDGAPLALLRKGDHLLAGAIAGSTNVSWSVDREKLQLQIGPQGLTASLKICWVDLPESRLPEFVAWLKSHPALEQLADLKRPGPEHWPALFTHGQKSPSSAAYVIDTLTVPYENPWNALMFTSGVDFLPDGRAAVCTIHGDVWLVSGIDANLDKLTWKRFATGLFQPLGLRVRDGNIFVLGRDQITCLRDENEDGEADYYENFFNGIHTAGGHNYVTSLEKDSAGNFYFVDPEGVHRVAADGRSQETIASGWRNPNGMGITPDGKIILVSPQQGEWTPSSVIAEAKPAGWYGYGGPRLAGDRPLGYDLPLCWIPHRVDNSSGSQLWAPSDKWGPLQNHFLHFSFGRCAEFVVLREVVDGLPQAAVAQIPGKFLSGVMRGAFNPVDGQLYVAGSTGWQTSAARDGCLQRVRFTGADTFLPIEVHAHTNGLQIKFSTRLDRAAAEDPGSYSFTHWNYRYTAAYGSADYSVASPEKEGRDTLEIKSARLLSDKRTVVVEIPGIRPVMQWELKYSLNSISGKSMLGQLDGTIHKLAPAWPNL
jgi:hypothetical protein